MIDRRERNLARKADLNQLKRTPEVESYLMSTFRPVAPRSDFVSGLKSRLTDPATIQKPQVSNGQLILLLIAAMAGTVILVAGMLRLVIELIGAVTIMRLYSRETQGNSRSGLD